MNIDDETLTILQYNIRNGKNSNMIPLLADKRLQEYDVLAIQEPWKSDFVPTSYNPRDSGFHLLFKPGGDTRVCFYISTRIDPERWEVEYPSPDMCNLKIQVKNGNDYKLINIHDVYNPSPISYNSINSPTTLETARRGLSAEGEHILLGDFNLHHPYWCAPTRVTQHAMADRLIDIVEEKAMNLTLPAGTVTWQKPNSFSTIDLTFMIQFLQDRLIHCMDRPEMNQTSDHIPISTKLFLGVESVPTVMRRAWKSIDMEKLKLLERNALDARFPETMGQADEYVEEIRKFLHKVIENTVPWSKPSTRGRPFWSPECDRVTKTARKAH